jgi:nitric oxide reductase large subunit
MFMFDIETLGVESTTVILSAGIIYFDPEKDADISYKELVERGLFVKLDAKDQLKRLDRTITKSTLDWWAKQGEYQRSQSFDTKPDDIKVEEGIAAIKKYINKYAQGKLNNETMWARGSLDQMAIDSLTNKCGVEPIINFARWRDMRTAIDMLTGSTNGYCKVANLDMNLVLKHHPVDDCALDILMLLRGMPEPEQ